MSLIRSKPKHILGSILGVLVLAPTLLLGGAAHADTASPPRGTVATNLPDVFAFAAPPQGFNPATAGNADLQRYGFPLPPSSGTQSPQYQSWLNVVRHAQHEVIPTFTPHPEVKNALSPNWSGAVTSGSMPCGGRLCLISWPTEVYGGWTVPSVTNSTESSSSSTWVGLDGWGNGQVEQMGTAQDAIRTCYFLWCYTSGVYYPWYELYPAGEEAFNVPLRAGDIVWSDVHYYGSDNTLGFWFEDLTAGQYAVFAVTATYGCRCVSAEWITEAPSVGNTIQPLADFVHTHISDANFVLAPSGYAMAAMASAYSPFTVNMVNGSGFTKAYGYAPALDQIDSEWVNYGP